MLDVAVLRWISHVVHSERRRHARKAPAGRSDPQKLHFLFTGYNGHRNTGSDVRMEEMLRQVRRVFGPDQVRETVVSFDQNRTRGYFGAAAQYTPVLLPGRLRHDFTQYDVVLAGEGSTFTSRFTDLLSAMMVGILGVATAQHVPTVAYGAEADRMNPLLQEMVADHCGETLIITRNRQSQQRLAEIGLTSDVGTDTAWTFEPHRPSFAEQELKQAGWRGEPVLVLCPINPFWWPVRPSILKGVARLFGGYRESHHSALLFMSSGPEVESRFETYLSAWAEAVNTFRQRTKVFPILVASEQLDNRACRRLATKLGGAPTFSASDYDMYELVSILRAGTFLLSSRYHAILTSMPGRVASAGVSMDQRIASLMEERGHSHLLASVDDPHLAERMMAMLESLHRDRDQIAADSSDTVIRHLGLMATMGRRLQEHVCAYYPQFGQRPGQTSWEDYLPPLGPTMEKLLKAHGDPIVGTVKMPEPRESALQRSLAECLVGHDPG